MIQTVCNGVPRSEGYTDSKGYFSVELGSNRGVIQDASEYSNSNTTMGALVWPDLVRRRHGLASASTWAAICRPNLPASAPRRCR